MAVTVEELQILLKCDATQAQTALTSLNKSVDKAVEKMSQGGKSGNKTWYETMSKRLENATKKMSDAYDRFNETGDSGAKADLGYYATQAKKAATELSKFRDVATKAFGGRSRDGAIGDAIENMSYLDKSAKKVSDRLNKMPKMDEYLAGAAPKDGAIGKVIEDMSYLDESAQKVSDRIKKMPKFDEYLIGESKGGALGNAIEDMAYKLPKAVSSRLKKMPKLDEYLTGEAPSEPTVEYRGQKANAPWKDQWSAVTQNDLMSGYGGDMMRRAAAWMNNAQNDLGAKFQTVDMDKLLNGSEYERLGEALKLANNKAESLKATMATIGSEGDPAVLTRLNNQLTKATKDAEKLAKQMAAIEDGVGGSTSDAPAKGMRDTGSAAEEATPKINNYNKAVKETGKSSSFFSKASKFAHGIFDKFGKSFKHHEGFLSKFGKTLKRVMMRMLAMGLIRGVINGIRQGLQLLTKSNAEAATQFGRFSAMAKGVKIALGSAALAALNAVAGILFTIASAAIAAANAIARFFAVLGGGGTYFATTMSDSFDDLSDSIGGAGGAAKGLLADFDELNIIGQQGGGGGGGGLSGTGGITSSEETAISHLADLLKAEQFEEAGAYIAEKLGEISSKIDKWFIDLDNKHYGKKFADIVNGFFSDSSTFKTAGKTVADGLNTVIHFFDDFFTNTDFLSVGEGFGETVMSIFTNVDWESAGHSLGEGINGIKDTIKGFLDKLDTKEISSSLNQALSKAFRTVDWKDLGSTLSKSVLDSIDFLANFILDFDWSGTLQAVIDFIEGTLSGLLSNPFKLVAIVDKLIYGVVGSAGQLVAQLLGDFADQIFGRSNPFFGRGEMWASEWKTFMQERANDTDAAASAMAEYFGLVENKVEDSSNAVERARGKIENAVDTATNKLEQATAKEEQNSGRRRRVIEGETAVITRRAEALGRTPVGVLGQHLDKLNGTFDETSSAIDNMTGKLNMIPKVLKTQYTLNVSVAYDDSGRNSFVGGNLANITILKMASGGLAYGNTFANIGEYPNAKSNPEVVAPLSKLQDILAKSSNNSADVKRQNELLTEQNRLLRIISQKELVVGASAELGQVVKQSQALFGAV